MTQKSLSIILVLLAVLTLLSIVEYLNSQVSWKYEVDQARILVQIDTSKSADQKQSDFAELDKDEKNIFLQMDVTGVLSILCPISVILLLLFRKRIVKG